MKSKLQQRREVFDLSRTDLAVLSDVSVKTIQVIELGTSWFKTSVSVAESLARALDSPVEDLFDVADLSHLGRPASTGKPIIRRREMNEMVCPDCLLLVPADVGCTNCEQPARTLVTT